MSVRILIGDCRTEIAKLPEQSVHCCVTSPPYFGLRDYGTASWSGGDPNCPHTPDAETLERQFGRSSTIVGTTTHQKAAAVARSKCKCGAVRVDSQIGLEATPDAFVAEMVAVFREVRRVLRDDGTLWLNLGDSYNAYNGGAGPSSALSRGAQTTQRPQLSTGYGLKFKGLKPKDLIGIPWRVAFALQADGWYLRQDIIWSKPNPMPESVTDRCTKAHEYIFLMSKSARYFYDAEAIKEDAIMTPQRRLISNQRIVEDKKVNVAQYGAAALRKSPEQDISARNKRSVWTVSTSPFAEAHFATFPPDLIEPCILAGCPIGGTVLDPFGGAGTTGLVADRLQRSSVLIELNPEYAAMAERRIHGDAPLFVEAAE